MLLLFSFVFVEEWTGALSRKQMNATLLGLMVQI